MLKKILFLVCVFSLCILPSSAERIENHPTEFEQVYIDTSVKNNSYTSHHRVSKNNKIHDIANSKDFSDEIIVLMLIMTGISGLLWFVFGRDKADNPIVSFYPPENLNSAEVGMLYRQRSDSKDIVSIIYYLALKGYIKIIGEKMPNEKDLYSMKNYDENLSDDLEIINFKFKKLKKYDGNNEAEKMIMDILFSKHKLTGYFDDVYEKYKNSLEKKGYNRETFISSNKYIVTETQLKDSKIFESSINSILCELDEFKGKMLKKDTIASFMKYILFVCFEIVLLVSYWALFGYSTAPLESLLGFVIDILCITMGAVSFFIMGTSKKYPLSQRFLGFIMGIVFMSVPVFLILSNTSRQIYYTPVLWIGFVCLFIIGLCINNLERWSEYAQNLRNQILGFRKFLKTVNYSNLDSLVAENPNYCFEIIPYAYILNISLENIIQNESLMTQNPFWYEGDFSYHSFKTLSEMLELICIPPESSFNNT